MTMRINKNQKKIIKNGIVYDPLNNINGEKMDIFIDGCRIVDEDLVGGDENVDVIDVKGCAVMPAGVDVHTHVATYGLNFARFIFNFPTVSESGRIYAMMGYAHVNEPLMTLETASYVHHELASIPLLDASAFLAVSLRDIANEIRENDHDTVRAVFQRLAEMTKAIGIKIYDARVSYEKKGFFYRDVDMLRCMQFLKSVVSEESRDAPAVHRAGGSVRDEAMEASIAVPAEEMAIHVRTSAELLSEVPLDVLKAFRLAHIASGIVNDETYEKAEKFLREGGFADIGISVPHGGLRLVDAPRISSSPSRSASGGALDTTVSGSMLIDIGFDRPLMFRRGSGDENEATAMRQIRKQALYSFELAIDALTEKYSNVAFSTDSPNGCIFADYPKIFAALMDRQVRSEIFSDAISDEEYSLFEIVRVRSANTARMLGLHRIKGHLGTGALADIAIYEINDATRGHEIERKLRRCKFLLKSGDFVVYNGNIVQYNAECRTFHVVNSRRNLNNQNDRKTPPQEAHSMERENVRRESNGEGEKADEKVEKVLRRICDSRSFRREHLRVDDVFVRRY